MTGRGLVLAEGCARGRLLWLAEPVSFWGGVDPESGQIIDRHHPQSGRSVTGMVVALPHGRGSSSSPSVLAEMIRLRTGPAGLIMREADPMMGLGSLVAAELYDIRVPVVVLDDPRLRTATEATIGRDGEVKIH